MISETHQINPLSKSLLIMHIIQYIMYLYYKSRSLRQSVVGQRHCLVGTIIPVSNKIVTFRLVVLSIQLTINFIVYLTHFISLALETIKYCSGVFKVIYSAGGQNRFDVTYLPRITFQIQQTIPSPILSILKILKNYNQKSAVGKSNIIR